MLVRGHTDLSLTTPHPLPRPGTPECSTTASATFRLTHDVSSLFPFINGHHDGARYCDNPLRIQFTLDWIAVTLFARDVVAVPFYSVGEAHAFALRLVDHLNDLHDRRGAIEPDHRRHEPLSVLSVLKTLPGTNCGLCAQPTCIAFAVEIAQGRAHPSRCPEMPPPIATATVYPVYDAAGTVIDTVSIQETDRGKTASDHPLTGREVEVLRHLSRGLTNVQIASVLGITLNTVKSHVTHVFDKLGVDDRTEAAVWAVKQGLVD